MFNGKVFIKNVARKFGYDIRRLGASPLRSTITESYQLLANLGFRPRTIIDVGVASGTYELYEAFPEAELLLLEPLIEFETDLRAIMKKFRGSYILTAASKAAGEAVLNVHGHLDGSSLYKERSGPAKDGVERIVPLTTVDELVRARKLKPPFLIKADVQGAELEVLDGCKETLPLAEAIVLEVSMFKFQAGTPELHDVITYMRERNFVAFDIIPALNRELDNALAQLDAVFVKEGGQFRQEHGFSRPVHERIEVV